MTEKEKQRKIKGIVFDFDGTLYSQPVLRGLMALSLGLKYVMQPKATKEAARIILNFRKAQELLRDKESSEDLLGEQIKLASELSGSEIKLTREIIDKWFFKAPLKFLPLTKRLGLIKLFSWLKNNNYKIGIFSDYPSEVKSKTLGIDKFVDEYVSSCDTDLGCLKPSTKGFIKIADKLDLKPAEILYVGDREDVDKTGSENAGMKFLLINMKNIFKMDKGFFTNAVKKELIQLNTGVVG